jgi:hypothetical protein
MSQEQKKEEVACTEGSKYSRRYLIKTGAMASYPRSGTFFPCTETDDDSHTNDEYIIDTESEGPTPVHLDIEWLTTNAVPMCY